MNVKNVQGDEGKMRRIACYVLRVTWSVERRARSDAPYLQISARRDGASLCPGRIQERQISGNHRIHRAGAVGIRENHASHKICSVKKAEAKGIKSVKREGVYESLTHSLPLARPSRASVNSAISAISAISCSNRIRICFGFRVSAFGFTPFELVGWTVRGTEGIVSPVKYGSRF